MILRFLACFLFCGVSFPIILSSEYDYFQRATISGILAILAFVTRE